MSGMTPQEAADAAEAAAEEARIAVERAQALADHARLLAEGADAASSMSPLVFLASVGVLAGLAGAYAAWAGLHRANFQLISVSTLAGLGIVAGALGLLAVFMAAPSAGLGYGALVAAVAMFTGAQVLTQRALARESNETAR